MFALLIDPEKASDKWLHDIISTLNNTVANSQFSILNFCDKRVQWSLLRLPSVAKINNEVVNSQFSILNSQLLIFVGGSQLKESIFNVVEKIKSLTAVPVVMFPGDASQFAENVDALLFLSLASGRNAKYLIEQHIKAAPLVRDAKVECISTGYILIDGKKDTAVARVSNTTPYPTDDMELIANTALACQLLGHKMVYLEAGSGANRAVPTDIVKHVRQTIDIPLIVGGGIKSPEQMQAAYDAGADLVVVGNHLESHPEDLSLFSNNIKS